MLSAAVAALLARMPFLLSVFCLMAVTLAHNGVNPMTGERAPAPPMA